MEMMEGKAATASWSTPANTVVNLDGTFECFEAIVTAGRAFDAAQPQTEFTIKSTVSSAFERAASTSDAVVKSSKPTDVNSDFIGATSSAGYIIL